GVRLPLLRLIAGPAGVRLDVGAGGGRGERRIRPGGVRRRGVRALGKLGARLGRGAIAGRGGGRAIRGGRLGGGVRRGRGVVAGRGLHDLRRQREAGLRAGGRAGGDVGAGRRRGVGGRARVGGHAGAGPGGR